jgi:sugar phosphate isomerase/epimerase
MPDRERILVSSSTFIRFPEGLANQVAYGVDIGKNLLQGGIYAPEIDQAIKAAKEFGLGLEIAYRVGLGRASNDIQESGVTVEQLHGPVVWSLKESVSESVGTNSDSSFFAKMKGAALGVGMAKLANGTLESNWKDTERLAYELGARSIVLHPNGAQILYKNRGVILGLDENLVVGIEPDFRRMKEKPGIIWDPEKVIQIAQITDQGVCLDTSHTGITYNSVADMFRLYEKFKKEVRRGVVAIHFSVAIPNEDREDFFTKGTGARPLYRDTPDMVKSAYREFYQQVMKDPDFNGPLVLEMFAFPKGNSMDERRKAIEETLDVLEGSDTPDRIYR